ncbi:MAG: hypothetical protein QOK21_76 [Solirubrobacteraceae bacterium]|nr:hypothetical protein [Solirubrobacteraceae bacterium]
MTRPRVLLAHADPQTRAGLRVMLSEGGFTLAGEVSDADSAVTAAEADTPELVVLATRLPGGGIAAAGRISAARPGISLVLLADDPSGEELVEAVLAGASGYLAPDISQDRLAPTLHRVLAGEVALPRRYTQHVLDELLARNSQRTAISARASSPMTDREWEVLQLLGGGASSAEIANRLRISEVTVRRHASAVVAKLGAANRAEAVQILQGRSAV